MKRTSLLGLILTLLCSPVLFASVVVTPSTPSSNDAITIRLENMFGAEARVASSSISRVGNTFLVEQNVDLSCFSPSNPVVMSEFQVGPLPPGVYDVVATITFNGSPFPCSKSPVTQTASFMVTAVSIPTLSGLGLLTLAVALAASALLIFRS